MISKVLTIMITMSLLEQVQHLKTGWKDVLLQFAPKLCEESDKEFQDMGLNTYPEKENIFRCFNYFNPEDTKVVILGQDPYHGEGEAIGLCFGVNNDSKKLPPSLKNIEKELVKDLDHPLTDYSLEKWAQQGVLLLNVALTVVQGKPGSNINLWNNYECRAM